MFPFNIGKSFDRSAWSNFHDLLLCLSPSRFIFVVFGISKRLSGSSLKLCVDGVEGGFHSIIWLKCSCDYCVERYGSCTLLASVILLSNWTVDVAHSVGWYQSNYLLCHVWVGLWQLVFRCFEMGLGLYNNGVSVRFPLFLWFIISFF